MPRRLSEPRTARSRLRRHFSGVIRPRVRPYRLHLAPLGVTLQYKQPTLCGLYFTSLSVNLPRFRSPPTPTRMAYDHNDRVGDDKDVPGHSPGGPFPTDKWRTQHE